MKRHVFTVAPLPEGKTATIRVPELVHQVVRVLRLRIGEELVLVDGKGGSLVAEIVGYSERSIEIRCRKGDVAAVGSGLVPAAERSVLCAAILKKDRFEWLTEKLAEQGITDLVPLVTARTIKKDVRLDRLQTIAQEAMEQSGQARCMAVHAPLDLPGAVRFLQRSRLEAVVCDIGPNLPPLEEALRQAKCQAVFVGPEGGWSDEERVFFEQEARYPRASLGSTVLRGETAGMLAAFCLRRNR